MEMIEKEGAMVLMETLFLYVQGPSFSGSVLDVWIFFLNNLTSLALYGNMKRLQRAESAGRKSVQR